MSVFKEKTLLITGGTGSFGNAVLRRFLDSDIKEIRIFSRDEKNRTICVMLYRQTKSNITLVMSAINLLLILQWLGLITFSLLRH